MTRICFFSGDITRSGGTERVSTQLANLLSNEEGYDTCFMSLTEKNEKPFYFISPTIHRYHLSKKWINPGPGYIPLIGKLRTFLKEHDIDIIIDIDIVLDVLSIPASKGLKTKVVSWEHFTADFEHSVFYRKMILKYSVKRSDYVVVLTDGDLKDYQAMLKRKQNITRIYNLIADEFRKPTEQKRENIILTVGRLVPEKGIAYLEQVAVKLLNQYPEWTWIILGEGPERNRLETCIQKNHFEHQLKLMGNVNNVVDYLKRASIFVVTSKYEGLGMNLLEARSMQIPCVSFDVKMGPREIIHNNVDGYLIPSFDCDEMAEKIKVLMEHPEIREQFSQRALLSMNEFETDHIVKQWKKILNALSDE